MNEIITNKHINSTRPLMTTLKLTHESTADSQEVISGINIDRL